MTLFSAGDKLCEDKREYDCRNRFAQLYASRFGARQSVDHADGEGGGYEKHGD